MDNLSVGAVGAAIIAALVSLLGLIIGKEQKVSEFRQAWIDDLRKCMVGYLVNINAISDAIRLSKVQSRTPEILENYKLLNEANHGIKLRINDTENPAKELLVAMTQFEVIANVNSNLTPEKILTAEENFSTAAHNLLKFEWKRVKRGELVYVWTKRIVTLSILMMFALFVYVWNANVGQKQTDQADTASRAGPNIPTCGKDNRPICKTVGLP